MKPSGLLKFTLFLVAIVAPAICAASFKMGNFPKLLDFTNYIGRFRKSYSPAEDSQRKKIFIGQSMGIFKHNVLFLQNKSQYYLSQSALMDLTPDELKRRQGQNSDLDLKPVLEAREYGDLPANYLASIQTLTDDGDQDELIDPGEQPEYISVIHSNEGLKKILDLARDDYMTPGAAIERKNKANEIKANVFKVSDHIVEEHIESPEQVVSSFSDSVNNLLDEPIDDIVSSFSSSVDNLLKNSQQDITDVMNPKKPSSPVKYTIDWRVTGCIGQPKAQGECNACYIFATLDLLEYFYCRQTKTKAIFSRQHVMDCGRELGLIKGCQGGRMSEVGQFIREHGLRLDSEFPYTGKHGECKSLEMDNRAIAAQIKSWHRFDSITAWYTWARKSPILVGINLPSDFHVYGGGIHDGLSCDMTETHAMLLVGAGTQDGIEFWLLKNSYSEDWGEKGYFRLSKSAKLNCFGSAIVARASFNQ